MNIIELIFRANTQAIKSAEGELNKLKKTTTETKKEAGNLAKGLDALGNTGGPIGEVVGKVNNLKNSLASAVSVARLLPPLLVAAAASAGVIAATRFAPILDSLDKLGRRFGYTTSQAALLEDKLQGAGGLAGYAADIDRVARALSRADEEGSRAANALEYLGVSVENIKSPQEAINQLVTDYADKVAAGNLTLDEQQALIDALGPTYKELIFRQQEAADALQMYNDFAEKGIYISQAGSEATNEYNEAMDGLNYIFKVVGSQLVGDIIPAFTGLINQLVASYKNGGLVYSAFQLIRAGADLLMVPVRLLINLFVALDAAVQSIGKSVGALFEAIRTRSLDPLKNLGGEIAKVMQEAQQNITPLLGWTGDNPVGAKPPRVTKDTRGDYVAKTAKNKTDEKTELMGPDDSIFEEARRQEEANKRLAQSYVDLIDPTAKYVRQLAEVQRLRQAGLLTADQALEAEFRIQEAINKTIEVEVKRQEQLDLGAEATKYVAGQIADSLGQAFTSAEFSFKSFLASMLKGLAQLVLQLTIIKPLMSWFETTYSSGGWGAVISSAASFFGFANGGAFNKGVQFFANGGVVNRPTAFSMAGGIGVMGEAGPEAILPLHRDSTGKLGVKAAGSSVTVHNNISVSIGSIDSDERQVALMREINKQVEAQTNKAIANQLRPGGMLFAKK